MGREGGRAEIDGYLKPTTHHLKHSLVRLKVVRIHAADKTIVDKQRGLES